MNGCSKALCPMQVGCADNCKLTKKECPYFTAISGYQEMVAEIKEEAAREIFAEIDREIRLTLESNYKARDSRQMIVNAYGSSTLDRDFIEYVSGKIDALRGINDFVAELKKKYTEGQK